MTDKANSITQPPERGEHKDTLPALKIQGAEAGKSCPVCKLGIMDYDGLLNLVCPVCGFTEGGCFT